MAGACAAHALDPSVPLGAYQHTIWTGKEGAPSAITTLAQSRDGWLWLGTPAGLYRFDGVKFSRFVPGGGTALLSSNISRLYAQPDGQLLVGYINGGLSMIDGNKVVHLAQRAHFGAVVEVARDSDGSLWAATMSGLYRLKQGSWTRFGAELGFPGNVAKFVVLDPYDRLWAGTDDQLYRFDRHSGKFIEEGPPGPVDNVIRSPDGRVWRGADDVYQVVPPPAGTPLRPSAHWLAPYGEPGMFDHNGNYWALRCPVGLCRASPRFGAHDTSFALGKVETERLDQPWQMGSLAANALLEDREGNIWVGTFGSLERFSDSKLVTVPVPPGASFYAVIRGDRGQAMVASVPSGHLFDAGTTAYGRLRRYLAIAAADDGGVLVADSEGIEVRKNGAAHPLAYPKDSRVKPHEARPTVLVGSTDDFWLGLSGIGLFRFQAGTWTPAGALGVPPGTRCISTDANGAAWIGNRDGSVLRLQGGQATRFSADAQNEVGAINFIDARHGVLIAGDETVAVLVDGKFRRLHVADPELLAGVSGMVVTSDGTRWLNGRKGVVRISAQAWKNALARPDQPVQATVFDGLDGYPGAAQSVNGIPSATESSDGKLWFVGTSGVAYLDPAHLSRNTVAPGLSLGRLDLPGARLEPDGGYTLPPGSSALRLDYTALSLTQPERVRFRYQLEGVDEKWQAAGSRRAAFYTNLGPGHYRFRVVASNEDGVESAVAEMRITILPTLVQTVWFKSLCVALLAGLLFLAHRWRMRRLATRHWERFQERLQERERIARGLHDNLMQNFQALIMFFRLHSDKLAAGDANKAGIDSMLRQAADVMAEAREEISGLRSRGEDDVVDLGHALATFGKELEAQFGPQFALTVAGRPCQLTAFAFHELYAIGREAIFNAYQHAHPTRVDVALEYAGDSFALQIRDDGDGIDANVLDKHARHGHWGLPGMRERAQGLAGRITARRLGNDGGTEILVKVRASRVYATAKRRWWNSEGAIRAGH